MKKLLTIIVLGLLISSNAYAEKITYNCKFPEGAKRFNGQYKFDLELKELTGIGKYNGTMVELTPEIAVGLEGEFGKFLLGYGKEGFTIDNGYENEIALGIRYKEGTTGYFFFNREKSALIVHIFTVYSPAQLVMSDKIRFDKVGENMKNRKHLSDKVMEAVVQHAVDNFSENYLGAVEGKCS